MLIRTGAFPPMPPAPEMTASRAGSEMGLVLRFDFQGDKRRELAPPLREPVRTVREAVARWLEEKL
jgi:hypothetical protein